MAIVAAGAAVISAGVGAYSAYNANSAQDDQKDANRKAENKARETQNLAEQAHNKLNQKKPANANTLLTENAGLGKGGVAGTMLTGPSGIDPAKLQLGKSTLLGGS